MIHRSMFLKCFLVLLVVMIALFTSAVYSMSTIVRDDFAQAKYDNLNDNLSRATQYLNLYLQNIRATMLLAAGDGVLSGDDDAQIRDALEKVLATNAQIDNLYLRRDSGEIVCPRQYILDALSYAPPAFAPVFTQGGVSMSGAYDSRMMLSTTVAMVVRLNDAELIGEIKMSELSRNTQSVLGSFASFVLLTQSGELLTYNVNSLDKTGAASFLQVRISQRLLEEARAWSQRRIRRSAADDLYIATSSIQSSDWLLTVLIDKSDYLSAIDATMRRIRGVLYASIPALLLASLVISNSYTKSVRLLSARMDSTVTLGERRLPPRLLARRDELGCLARSFDGMLERLSKLTQSERDHEKQRTRLEMKLLQSQISPHFFANTLSCIIALLMQGQSERVLDALRQLIRILNYGVDRLDDEVPLESELQFIDAYLEIHRMRKRRPFELELQVQKECLKEPIPKLLLQPIVENCLFHAFANEAPGQKIVIGARLEPGAMLLFVEDNGCGMRASRAEDALNRGVGLRNVRERVRILYGESYGLNVESEPGKGTRVSMRLPSAEAMA